VLAYNRHLLGHKEAVPSQQGSTMAAALGIALERHGSLLSAAPLRQAAERMQRTGGSLSGSIGLGETGDCGTPALRGDSGGCT